MNSYQIMRIYTLQMLIDPAAIEIRQANSDSLKSTEFATALRSFKWPAVQ